MSPAVIAFKSLLPEGRSTESSEEELSETATSAMVVFPWLPGNELVGPPILQNMQMRGKGQRGKFLPLCHLALVRLHVGRSAQKQQSFRELELFPLKNMCRSVVKKCIWHVRKIEFSILLQKLAIWTSGRGESSMAQRCRLVSEKKFRTNIALDWWRRRMDERASKY